MRAHLAQGVHFFASALQQEPADAFCMTLFAGAWKVHQRSAGEAAAQCGVRKRLCPFHLEC